MSKKIELAIEANTKGVIDGMKAVQTNVNKIADSFVNVERNGASIDIIKESFAEFADFIDRAGRRLVESGKAADIYSAKMTVLSGAIESATAVKGGENSEVVAYLKDMYAQLSASAQAAEELRAAMEAAGDSIANVAKFWETFDTTEALNEYDDLIARQQVLYDQMEKQFNQAVQEDYFSVLGDKAGLLKMRLEELKKQLKEYLEEARKSGGASEELSLKITNTAKSINKVQNELSGKGLSGLISKFAKISGQVLIFRTVMNIWNSTSRLMKQVVTEGVQYAAEAEQTYAKLNTVFGEYNDNISTAIALSGKLGVATQTSASALSTVGDLLQAQGVTTAESLSLATEWVEKFSDIIAFKDVDMSLEEFAQNWMSGAAGNLRNFRSVGAIVRESTVQARLQAEGLDQLTGSELEAQKMIMRSTIAFEQLSNAMGATNDEWDTMQSINRRTSEQWKEWTTNVGDQFIPVLKEVKSWWAGILEQSNKAAKAAKLYADGVKSIKVYDITDSEDFNAFDKAVLGGYAGPQNKVATLVNNLKKTMTEYGATAEQVMDRVNAHPFLIPLSKSDRASVKAQLAQYEEALEYAKKAEAQVSVIKNDLAAAAENADAFVDSLGALKGVNVTSDLEKRIGLKLSYNTFDIVKDNALISDVIEDAIGSAVSQIQNAGPGTYMTAADLIFDEDATKKAYQSWADEVEQLYRLLFNRDLLFHDVDEKFLSDLKTQYGLIKDTISAYDGIEKIKSSLSSHQDDLKKSRYESIYSSSGLNSSEASAMASWSMSMDTLRSNYAIALKYADALGLSADELTAAYEQEKKALTELRDIELKKARDAVLDPYKSKTSDYQLQLATAGMSESDKTLYELNKALVDAVDDPELQTAIRGSIAAFKQLTAVTDSLTKAEENQKSIDEYYGKTQDYLKQAKQLGMTDSEKILDDLETALKTAELENNQDLVDEINGTIWAFKKLTAATKEQEAAEKRAAKLAEMKESLNSNLGVTGEFANHFETGSGTFWLDMVQALMDIMYKTEEWTDFVATLDSVWDPIVDAMAGIASVISRILVPALEVVLPLMQVFASAIALIGFMVETIADDIGLIVAGIVGSFIEAYNWVAQLWGGGLSYPQWVTDAISATDDNADKLVEILEKIWGEEVDINANTKNNNLAYAQDLYKRGQLTQQAYLQEINGTRYASTISSAGVQYTTRGDSRYVTINNLTIDGSTISDMASFVDELDRYTGGGAVIGYSAQL